MMQNTSKTLLPYPIGIPFRKTVALFTWSKYSDLNFNLKKFVYLSFRHKFNATYDTPIPRADYHKDLGLISEDLSWDRHYKFIISHAYIR